MTYFDKIRIKKDKVIKLIIKIYQNEDLQEKIISNLLENYNNYENDILKIIRLKEEHKKLFEEIINIKIPFIHYNSAIAEANKYYKNYTNLNDEEKYYKKIGEYINE